MYGRAARTASSPTLARRFPVGPGDAPLPAGTSTARTGNLHSRTTYLPRLTENVSGAPEHDGQLEAPVERDGHGQERGVRLARLRVRAERLDVREHVVGDDQRAGLELRAREPEELLVVVLLGVQEDDVEDVVDRGHPLLRVAVDEVGPVLEPGLIDVLPPRIDLAGVVLDGEDPSAEVAHACGEPDRRVAARAADLQHLAVGLRCDEGEQEPSGRGLDRTGAFGGGETRGALGGVLLLETRQHSANALIQQRRRSPVARPGERGTKADGR